MRRVVHTWWPLAASWLLMGAELPALSAVIARLANPEISLAAYGGVVFPLALIVESPIIMLLAASTALSKDWDSYVKLRRFMMTAGFSLTVLHVIVAFTPLYYGIVEKILSVPAEIVEPARIGLMIMTPWSWAIAYRRFNQGVLIRFGHSQAVGVGTFIRLSADSLILLTGYLKGDVSGIVIAAFAVTSGVVCEAVYAGIVVRPVLRRELKHIPVVSKPVTLRSFLDFYIPLAMTSILTMLADPIGSAALSRMPEPLASLAVWPVVTGLIFMLQGLGVAFNEVVIALLDEPKSSQALKRFTVLLSGVTTGLLLILATTPLSDTWFRQVSALPPHLAELARLGVWVALPLPALSALQSWFQGAILHGQRTRGITESVLIYLFTSALVFGAGVFSGQITGLYIGILAIVLSALAQDLWLWYRGRSVLLAVIRRDNEPLQFQPPEAVLDEIHAP